MAECRAAADAVRDWALDQFADLPDRPVGASATPAELRLLLDHPPPDAGRPFADVLADFDAKIAAYAYRADHPRYLAFIPGAPSFPSVLGDWLTAAANYFAGVWLEAAGPAQVESTVLDWFRTWLGLPESTRGVLTGGGSEANLTALVVARERVAYADRGRAVLYVAEQRHSSIDRAAKVMGIHPSLVCPVPPVDDEFRLRGRDVSRFVARDRGLGLLPWAVVANAGATNTGTVDALPEIAAVCRANGLWFHVDAAYGWSAVLTEAGRAELSAIAEADSVTLDPHKWFAQTFEAGCVLVRDGQLLPATFAIRPDYLQDVAPNDDEVNFADHGIALTRRFRALKIWFSIQVLGLDWFRRLVAHSCGLAEYAQALLEQTPGFEILCKRRLSVVCFRYAPAGTPDADALNERLVRDLRATGRAFLSSTRLRGAFALRLCFINWRTTAADVEEVVALMASIGKGLLVVPNKARGVADRPPHSSPPT